MLFFDIPDIRYFWSTDEKFLSQFKEGEITKFIPYSSLDPVTKDISFWLNVDDVVGDKDNFQWSKLNEFYEWTRDLANDLLQEIKVYDKFFHSKKNLYSHTFKAVFMPVHSMNDPGELTKITNKFMDDIREKISDKFNVVLR